MLELDTTLGIRFNSQDVKKLKEIGNAKRVPMATWVRSVVVKAIKENEHEIK